GFIVSGSSRKTVIVRAIGPTLTSFGITNALANPVLELHDSTGAVVGSNDNWGDATNGREIKNRGFAPPNALESAILTSLDPGNYSAVVRGANRGIGVALLEVYGVDDIVGSRFSNISS